MEEELKKVLKKYHIDSSDEIIYEIKKAILIIEPVRKLCSVSYEELILILFKLIKENEKSKFCACGEKFCIEPYCRFCDNDE